MIEWYKRWRHTRGYGVHSPFAFAIVGEVVRPPRGYAHYGYKEIDNALSPNDLPHTRRHARMLLRLAAFLDVRSAFVPNDDQTSAFRTALLAANSGLKVTVAMAEIHRCSLITSTGDYIPLDTLIDLLKEPGRTVAMRGVPDGWAERLFEAIPEGLMFYSPDSAIVIHRPGMQKIAYSIRL